MPPPFGPRSDSNETFSQIERWIRTCDCQHRCLRWNLVNDEPPALPTRLLEIDASTDTTMIRLITSEQLPVGTQYLTLSHRWGTGMPLRLDAQSRFTLETGIPALLLPPTFRDAAIVATRLSIQYLWIDSLCILQDSLEDWARQAKQMATVYSNGYLNIAASDSEDSRGGLFRTRDVNSVQSFQICTSKGRTYLCGADTSVHDMDFCALSERAWVVQERFLCRRVATSAGLVT